MSQYVYIIADRRDKTLRVDVTHDLARCSGALRERAGNGCAARPRRGSKDGSKAGTDQRRLVYYEEFDSILDALARERVIRAASRKWKISLISTMNPGWRDLSAGLVGESAPPDKFPPPVSRRAPRRLRRRVRDRQHLYLDLAVRRLEQRDIAD